MSGDQLQLGEDSRTVTLRRAWEGTLRTLTGQVSKLTFESYIRPIRPLSFEDGVVKLGVATAFARDWLKRYLIPIQTALEEQLGGPLTVQFIRIAMEETPALLEDLVPKVEAPAATRKPTKPRMDLIPSLPISEKYTFDNYLTARSNRLAHAGAVAVAQSPGKTYNPLFIYGSSGLGKSHLLQAIANSAREINPQIRVAMIDGEVFTQHYVASLREKRVEEFRRLIRSVDIWLVDDIQFIANRDQTKEEFFHTFNALYQSGAQIVITSDRSPRELRTMEERLRSRFESGLIADINPPEPEIREAILLQRCEQEQWDVPRHVIEYIASAIQSNVRALEGALNRLVAYASVMNCPHSIELAQDILGDYFIEKPLPSSRHKTVSVEAVQIAVAEQFGCTQELLKSQKRDKQLALARHAAMYICRELTGLSLAQIGTMFGGRDHTTVQRSIVKIDSLVTHDRILASHLQQIRQRLDR
ncbi:MAG: chromosomal replication initiator protein DnaA [Chthonomonadales bacterium]